MGVEGDGHRRWQSVDRGTRQEVRKRGGEPHTHPAWEGGRAQRPRGRLFSKQHQNLRRQINTQAEYSQVIHSGDSDGKREGR